MSKQLIRVLIADGDPSMRRVCRMLLADCEDIVVIADAAKRGESVEMIALEAGTNTCILGDAEREALLGTISRIASQLLDGELSKPHEMELAP